VTEAIDLYRSCLAGRKETLCAHHPCTLDTLLRLTDLLIEEDDFVNVVSLLEEGVAVLESSGEAIKVDDDILTEMREKLEIAREVVGIDVG
jgi:hypothetical protein